MKFDSFLLFSENPILLSCFTFISGAILSLIFVRRSSLSRILSLIFALSACGILFLSSICSLLNQSSFETTFQTLNLIPSFHFYFTPLSAFFTAAVSGLSLVATLYAMDYAKEYEKNAAMLGFYYNLFLLGMNFVPIAQNVFSFLFCWEGMTLASFFLVIIEYEKLQSRNAGYIYFVMSQAGTAFIFILFFLLYRYTGSLEFESFRQSGHLLSLNSKNILFLFAFIGFGTKAGVVPLHLWLPYAHPAAPSHVSSLMSGVMIKTAIYGFILTVFTFIGISSWWWGIVVLLVAGISSLLGILYALTANDLKRLLAYSSVENIGIILMGVGTGMVFVFFGRYELAALALSAGLYHLINHAVFKSLLFVSAGSVIKSVHTKNMEKMGGLIKVMPVTAFCFFVGSMAISALPPFNGFISEWLTFQTLYQGFKLPLFMPRVTSLIVFTALALTSGLAAACFVKAFGITFLGLPRSESAFHAKDAPFFEKFSMILLSICCLIFGLFPVKFLKVIGISVFSILPQNSESSLNNYFVILEKSYGGFFPVIILVSLVSVILIAWILMRIVFGSAKVKKSVTWDCGMPALTSRMEYTETAFSKPFRILFPFLYRPVRELREESAGSPYFPTEIHYSTKISYLIKEKLYHPSVQLLLKISHIVRRIQSGSLNLYLGYLLTIIVVLLSVFIWKI